MPDPVKLPTKQECEAILGEGPWTHHQSSVWLPQAVRAYMRAMELVDRVLNMKDSRTQRDKIGKELAAAIRAYNGEA